jgi:hypothetical protein
MSNATENELLETVAKMHGLSVTQFLMQRAVGDSLMHDIVMDGRRGISNSASMIPDRERSRPVEKGTGWVDPRPLGPPPGAEAGGAIDRMVEADTQRQREEAELERQKKMLDRVRINMQLAEELRAFDQEQAKRDAELDPTRQLYSDPDKA